LESGAHTFAIEVADLSYGVRGKQILKGVSFDVPQGQYLVVIGPNGAGKTTLLKCLMRIYKKSGQSIRIFGKNLTEFAQKDLAKLVGYVPQADEMASGFSVYEFVAMGRYPYLNPFTGLDGRDRKKVDEALELTNTTALKERVMGTLSGGERQRVSIAAALAQEAKILLLDEPTSFLDPLHQVHVHELLGDLHQNLGLTIVTVTHNINAAAIWGEKVMALRNGRTVFSGDGDELMQNEVLESIYEKRFVFSKHPQTGKPVIVPDGRPA
jgi:iron complex transport system ATP-binding protein